MKHLRAILVLAFTCLLASSGCHSPRVQTPMDQSCVEGQIPPQGQMADYVNPAQGRVGSVQVEAPRACASNQGHIRLAREEGRRSLGVAGCTELPAPAQDFAQCPSIAPYALLHQVFTQLQARGIGVNGIGVSPCNEQGEYPELVESTMGVMSWQDADKAVAMLAEMMERYDIQGKLGVAVVGMACDVEPKGLEKQNTKLDTCRSATPSMEVPSESTDSDLAPGTSKLRFQYSASPEAKPVIVDATATKSRLLATLPDASGASDWFLQVNLKVPQTPHAFSFSIRFPRQSANPSELGIGDYPTRRVGLDIAQIEHGDECRVDPAQASQVRIQARQGDSASGSWRGNIVLEPAFYAEDAKPSGEIFVLESVVFHQVPVG